LSIRINCFQNSFKGTPSWFANAAETPWICSASYGILKPSVRTKLS